MRTMWWRASFLLLAMGFCTLSLVGCKRFIYAVPSPLVRYYDTAAPITVGLLMAPELRDSWFRYNSESMRKRVDVPTGKLALDFARANLREAFEHYYDERYYDRRSQEGLLIKVERIDFALDVIEVEVALHVRIEDESKTDILTKLYRVRGNVSPNRITPRVPFVTEKPQKSIEKNTTAAFEAIYGEMVTDILVLLGLVAPAPQAPPAEAPPPQELPQLTPLSPASPLISEKPLAESTKTTGVEEATAPATELPAATKPAATAPETDAPATTVPPTTGAAPTQVAPGEELQRPWQGE